MQIRQIIVPNWVSWSLILLAVFAVLGLTAHGIYGLVKFSVSETLLVNYKNAIDD